MLIFEFQCICGNRSRNQHPTQMVELVCVRNIKLFCAIPVTERFILVKDSFQKLQKITQLEECYKVLIERQHRRLDENPRATQSNKKKKKKPA